MQKQDRTDFLQAGTVLNGTYRTTKFVGAGGMGVVYEVEHVRTGRKLVAKILRPALSLDKDMLERFRREARAAASVGHPGIVDIIDVNQDESGLWYIVMEKLLGRDLSSVIQANAPMPIEWAIRIAKQLLEAIGAAHERGILHRDIKPANVFICEGGAVKILDFGIAKVISETSHATSGLVLGTPLYMAPEQACGEASIDQRADLFSCGAVLYEMLSGMAPFDGPSTPAILVRILTQDPRPLREERSDVPPHVDEAILTALSKSPSRRFADAAEFLKRLEIHDVSVAATEVSRTRPGECESRSGEIRTVTVLIVSLGMTTGRSSMDSPGFTLERMQQILRTIRQLITAQGGFVERSLGDSVVAVFGAPRASGDDTVRAVRAALLVQESEIGRGSDLRIGIGSGRVLAGHLDTQSGGYTVLGEAVNLARRIEAIADGGRILIDGYTAQRVKGRFKLEKAGEGVFCVLQEHPHGLVVASREVMGVATEMVGRETELSLLKNLYGRCAEEKQVQSALVIGPPGIGKSRLAQEFRSFVEDSSKDVVTLFGGAEPMHSGGPHGLLARMLRLKLGIRAGDTAEAMNARLLEYLRFFEIDRDAVFDQILGGLKLLVGSASGPQEVSVDVANVFRLLLDRISRRYPVVIVLEDLQWADASSLDILLRSMDRLVDRPVFVLSLARPEFREGKGKEFEGKGHSFIIDLRPITTGSTRKLIQQILGPVRSLGVVDKLVERAGGTPLFIEELIIDLVDKGMLVRSDGQWHLKGRPDQVDLPLGVEAILQSRLDGLPASDRDLLRLASVCGTTFWDEALADVGGAEVSHSLGRLIGRDFIVQQLASTISGCSEYSFRHALLRDTAYGNLLLKERQDLHVKLAGWFEKKAGGDFVGQATGFIREQRWMDLFNLARELEPTTAAPLARHLDLGGRKYDAAVAYLLTAEITGLARSFKEAHDNACRALEIANELGDASLRQIALGTMGELFNGDGSFDRAIEYFEQALHISNETGRRNIDGRYLRELAHCYAARQDEEKTLELMRMAEAAALDAGDKHLLCDIEKSKGLIYFMMGRDAEAKEHCRNTIEIAREIGYSYNLAVSHHNIADIHIQLGEIDEARSNLLASLDLCKTNAYRKLQNINEAFLCYLGVVTATEPGAIDRFEGHLGFTAENAYGWDQLQIHVLCGRALLHLGRKDEAREQFLAGRTMASDRAQKRFEKQCEDLLDLTGTAE